jgi:glucose-6-phosphate-specific signal transduction histidine kinase
MTRHTIERILRWTPRVLGLAFAAFVSLFALDVFGHSHTIGQTIVALMMHLVPTAVVLAALAISWRWGWAGGLVFLALGAWYLATSWGQFHWSAYVVIAGPLFLLGLLFELDWWYARPRPKSGHGDGS